MVQLNNAGAFLSLNGRISHSNRPKVVAKANFSVCLGLIGMCQYPLAKSRIEKNFVFASLFKTVSIQGKGSASLLIILSL